MSQISSLTRVLVLCNMQKFVRASFILIDVIYYVISVNYFLEC